MSVTMDLGKVGVLYKGEHDSTQTYERNDIVMSNGSGYIAKQNVPVGVDISNSSYWGTIVVGADSNVFATKEYTASIYATIADVSALQAAVGSPLIANAAADMTDTEKVYVYIGSETGYTSGNWYYYNGSAWVSGGTYNSQGIGDGSITTAKLADGAVTDAKLAQTGGVLEKVADLDNSVYINTALSPSATSSNWTLTGSGGSRSYTGNSLVKYQVVAGERYHLKLSKDWTYASTAEGVYQWQKAASVPSSDTNSNLVGVPVNNAVDTIVTAPPTATYLIISQKSNNTTNAVEKLATTWDDKIAKVSSVVRSLSFNRKFDDAMVASHGGSTNGTYVMNSMIGYKTAINNGDKLVEGDIRITSDGVPVMFHDVAMNSSNIAEWTGDAVYIGAMTYEQTQQYNLPKSSGKIPTLAEFLMLCKKQNVIAELDMAGKTWKSDEDTTVFTQAQAFSIVRDVVDKCGMRDSVMFTGEYSGSTNQISAWMGIDTDIVIGVSNRTSASAVAAIESVINAFPLVVCSVGTYYTDTDLMDAIHSYGNKCKAKAFSIESLAEVDNAFNCGVDFCMSYAITQNAYNQYLLG